MKTLLPDRFLQRMFACATLALLLVGPAKTSSAQNLSVQVAPNGSVDIPNHSGGNWYFSRPPAAPATMSRLSSNLVGEDAWGTANFQADPDRLSLNRLYSGEFLRVYSKTTPNGGTLTIPYDTSPANSNSPRYTVSIFVGTPPAQVTAITLLDPSPTAAQSVRFKVAFDHAVTGVTAANLAIYNSANITPAPTFGGIQPTVAGDNSAWTVTVNTPGTGVGLLGLNWVGSVNESPKVPLSFTGFQYTFGAYPFITQNPASAYVATNATPPVLTCAASIRTQETLHYQWMAGTSVTPGAATPVTGATSTTYQPPAATTPGTARYYCHVYTIGTNGSPSGYTADSGTATLTFETPVTLSSVSPATSVIATGNSTVLSASATGSPLRYQWYRGVAGDKTSPLSGETLSKLTTPVLISNTSYWLQVSNDLGSASSATCTVYVVSAVGSDAPSLTATVNGPFDALMALKVQDGLGYPVPGALVSFTIHGGATFPNAASNNLQTTDANGRAVAAAMTAGTKPGTYTVNAKTLASDGSLVRTLDFTLTVNPGPWVAFTFTNKPAAAVAGSAFTPAPTLEFRDAYNNLATSANAAVTLVLEGSPHSTLQGTTTVNAVNGVATFPNVSYTYAETINYHAFSGVVSQSKATTVVSAAPASTLTATGGGGQVAAPGAAFTNPLIVHLTDNYGNLIVGTAVTLTAPATGATAQIRALAGQTDGSGNAYFAATAGTTAGAYTVTANLSPALSTPATFRLYNMTPLQYWRQLNFAGDYLGTGAGADGATPYGDGVPNLLKYAFNLLPTTSDATPMSSTGLKGLPLMGREADGRLTLTYVRRKAATAPAITYQPQFGDSLASGAFAANAAAVTGPPVSIDATWERVTVTDSVVPGAGQPARFARVLVSDP